MTTLQLIQRDQVHDQERFHLDRIGWGMILAVLAILFIKAMLEWRR